MNKKEKKKKKTKNEGGELKSKSSFSDELRWESGRVLKANKKKKKKIKSFFSPGLELHLIA